MSKKVEVPTPASTTETRAPERETVSATPNKGAECEAFPLVDAGKDSGVGNWIGDGAKVRFLSDKN
jgi:hypothetical protein